MDYDIEPDDFIHIDRFVFTLHELNLVDYGILLRTKRFYDIHSDFLRARASLPLWKY